MRRFCATVSAILLMLILAAPALAWDSVRVQITGPGAAGPIAGSGGDLIPPLLDTQTLTSAPAGPLGPAFALTYSDLTSGHPYGSQVLYPYAAGGPATFNAAPLTIADHAFPAGWRQAPASTLDVLVALGLPPTAAAAVAGTGADSLRANRAVRPTVNSDAFGASPYWRFAAAGLAIAGVLVTGMIVAARRERPVVAA